LVFFVSSLLGLRGTRVQGDHDTVEGLSERREHNVKKLDQLQRRAQELEARKRERQHDKEVHSAAKEVKSAATGAAALGAFAAAGRASQPAVTT